MNILKSRIGALVLLSVVGYVVSFISQLIIAYHFGTSSALDAYWGGLALVNMLCFYMPALKEALVPAVHRARAVGVEQAGKLLSSGLSLLLLMSVFSCAILWFCAIDIDMWMSGDAQIKDSIIALTPWLLGYLVVLVLAETFNTVLISFDQVLRQALVRVGAAAILLLTVASVGVTFGAGGLLLAQILSMVMMIAASAWAVRGLKLRLLPEAWLVLKDSGVLPLFVSLLITYLFSQFYVVAERSAMMRLGTGLTSSFQYSTALVNVLISLLAYPLANLLWSQFLARAAEGDDKAAQVLAVRACGLVYYVLLVACVFIFMNAREIVSVLYGRGEFDELSVRMTTSALRATIFTAIPIGIGAVLGRWLISQPTAHRQLWIGLTTTGVGLLVISLAVVAKDSYWVMMHWLLANLAGMVISVFIFIRASRFDWPQRLAALRWLVLVGLVVVLALWLTPEVFLGTSVIQVTMALFVQGTTYLLIVLVLSWLFRINATLRYLLRGSS